MIPQPFPVQDSGPGIEQGTIATPRPQRQWLRPAQIAWVVVTALILGLDIAALPRYHAVLQTVCAAPATCFSDQLTPVEAQGLYRVGISIGLYAAFTVALNSLGNLTCIALGALLFWRRSYEPVALLCAFMLVTFFGINTGLHEGLAPLSLGWYAVVEFLDLLGQMSFVLFFFLFPTGRFVPLWTRWVALLYGVYYVWTIIIFEPGTFTSPLQALLFFGLVLTLVVAQIYRFRSVSTPQQRQQTKWVMYAVAVAIGGFILGVGSSNVVFPAGSSSVIGNLIGPVLLSVLFLLIPCSIVISILRSRLWDIDTIINRTLVYSSLTAILGALYAGLIIGLESIAGRFAGTTASNPLVLVISTLVIFALFTPLRRHIQSLIDRRFYRRKYDAQKTLDVFSATLRSEVDLGDLRERLLAVVQETMQPTHVWLWLAPPEQQTLEPLQRHEPQQSALTNQTEAEW